MYKRLPGEGEGVTERMLSCYKYVPLHLPPHHHSTTTPPPQHHHSTTTAPPQHHHTITTALVQFFIAHANAAMPGKWCLAYLALNRTSATQNAVLKSSSDGTFEFVMISVFIVAQRQEL